MNRINVLFICSRNRWRSPTAEAIYRDDDRVNVRSRGTTRNAAQTITGNDIQWADVVLAMEDKHRRRLLVDFPAETKFTPIKVLDIPDDYQLMDPELVELVLSATDPIIATLNA